MEPHTSPENSSDCYDLSSDASPNQTSFFDVNRRDGSFDYNCDSIEEREAGRVGSCTLASGRCILSSGWVGSVPACGVTGLRISSCAFFISSCGTNVFQDVQACR